MRRRICVSALALYLRAMLRVRRCSSLAFMHPETRRRQMRGRTRFHGRSTGGIANIRLCWGRLLDWESCGCECGFECGLATDALRLLQSVNGVHHSLKLGSVDQIESAFLAGKHFQRDAP